jgi:hypothetical protein
MHRSDGPKEQCPVRLFLRYLEITRGLHPVSIINKLRPDEADCPPANAERLWASNRFCDPNSGSYTTKRKTLVTVSYEAIRSDICTWLADCPGVGPEFKGHSLRGAVGSWLAEKGVPVFAILSRGGWTSLATFMRYYCRSLGNINFTDILSTFKFKRPELAEQLDCGEIRDFCDSARPNRTSKKPATKRPVIVNPVDESSDEDQAAPPPVKSSRRSQSPRELQVPADADNRHKGVLQTLESQGIDTHLYDYQHQLGAVPTQPVRVTRSSSHPTSHLPVHSGSVRRDNKRLAESPVLSEPAKAQRRRATSARRSAASLGRH